jgi:electron transport complex protein RnfG
MGIILSHKKQILKTVAVLTLFATLGAALVGLTFEQTIEKIKYNEKLTLLKKLNNIIPAESHNNDLLLDTVIIKPSHMLGTTQETPAYRARNNNKNVAVVFTSIAGNGYSGPIHLLVGVYANGSVAGVRVTKHKETPGLGDVVSITHSDWILGFNNKSLGNPTSKDWKVKRDGGIFDQFTGATITPRAVVTAVHDALLYFENNKEMLFNVNDNRLEPVAEPADKSDTKADTATEKHKKKNITHTDEQDKQE